MTTDITLRDRIAGVLRSTLLGEIPGSIRGVCDVYIGEATIRIDVVTEALLVEIDLGIPCARTGCKMRRIAREAADKDTEM